jgi:hypothetical protein
MISAVLEIISAALEMISTALEMISAALEMQNLLDGADARLLRAATL